MRDIIVIGGSAGAIEALSKILKDLPVGLPATIFVVVHVSPTGPGLLPDILKRAGALPASHALDSAPFERGHIYVAPPDYHLLISQKAMELSRGPRENRHRPSVDVLFRSAARAFGPRVIGVILTGALDDGALGLQSIKQQGGVAIVQDPNEAQQPGMPAAAFRYVAVDDVLPVRQIASRLVEWCRAEAKAPIRADSQVDSATKHLITAQEMQDKLGRPSIFVCPECSGPLWELKKGELVHYQCLTGHSFLPISLLEADGEALERALWIAIRTLEQRASLMRRLSSQTKASELNHSSHSFEAKARECEEEARLIRQIIEKGSTSKRPGKRRKPPTKRHLTSKRRP